MPAVIRLSLIIKISILVFALNACSSGGGSGGGDSSSGGSLSIPTRQVNFTASVDDYNSPSTNIRGSVSGATQSVYIYIAVTNNGIADAVFFQDSDTTGELYIEAKPPSSLSAGVYEDSVVVSVCLDSGCKKHINGSPKTIDVRYEITDDIRVNQSYIYANHTALDSFAEHITAIDLEGVDGPWQVSSDQPWLTTDIAAGTGPSQFNARIDPNAVAPGSYQGVLTIEDLTTNKTTTVNAELEVNEPYFSFADQTAAGLVADGVSASVYTNMIDFPFPDPVTFEISAPTWLIVEMGDTQFGSYPFTIRVDTDQLPPAGDYSETVQFYVELGGTRLGPSLPINVHISEPALTVSDRGVAFTHIANASVLQQTINIALGKTPTEDWNATIEYTNGEVQNWLSAEVDSDNSTQLLLSANPNGLANGETFEALVRVQNSSGTLSETIGVGLFVDTSLSSLASTTQNFANPDAAVTMVADPIRPLVYISKNSNTIEAYHVHTGTLFTSYKIGDSLIKHLTIANDGSVLYAMDEATPGIVKIELSSGLELPKLQPNYWENCNDCGNNFARIMPQYVRAHGHDILITNQPKIIDAETGEILNPNQYEWIDEAPGDGHVVPAGNGSAFLASDYYETGSAKLYGLTFNDAEQNFFVSYIRDWYANTARARQFSLNSDASKIYNACAYPNVLSIFNTATMALLSPAATSINGLAHLINDNEVLCVSYYQDIENSYPHAWRVNATTGELLNEYTVTGEINYNQHAVSGDGLRLITRSNDYEVLTIQNY